MTDEKPLHVRVAEALGCEPSGPFCGCSDLAHSDGYGEIPRYDTDWSATGPLIERLEISIRDTMQDDVLGWTARRGGWPGWDDPRLFGKTPLLAVCHLILALAALDTALT